MEHNHNATSDAIQLFLSDFMGKNPLADLHNYNDAMTISQVVKFFEKQGIFFTKTMIQNYIRVNVLPPPVDKRFYNKNHLILLMMIDFLKNIYSLDEIKTAFSCIMEEGVTFENNILRMTDVYEDYLEINQFIALDFKKALPAMISKSNRLSQENKAADGKKDAANKFLLLVMLMNQSILIKQIVQTLLKDHG